MQKPKVATVWCEGCAGCHMSFLDLDEALLDILAKVELTVTPITDFKDYQFPDVDLGIIEGGVGNEEQLEIVRHMRAKPKSSWPGVTARSSAGSTRCATIFPSKNCCATATPKAPAR